jgi:hypothetical protein
MTNILDSGSAASMDFWDNENDDIPERIERGDVVSFKAPESGIILEKTDERILVISQARLTGEPSGWRFKYNSDDISDFQADIFDSSFLDKIKDRKIFLKNGDMARVLLQTQQSRPRRNLKTVNTVLRVIEFLPFSDDEDDLEPEDEARVRKL